MALTNGTTIGTQGQFATIKAETKARVHFHLDASYPTGGYTAFTTYLKTILGTKITVVDVVFTDVGASGGYVLSWDRSADTLMVYGTGAADKAPLTEIDNATNLAAFTNVEAIVYYI